MATCYEHLRKKEKDDTFNRLSGYFRALEHKDFEKKINEYHDRQDKRKEKKLC